MPYILAHYNVEALRSNGTSLVHSFFARVVNSLVKGINESTPPHLPRYVVILLDKDFIENIRIFDYGVSEAFETMLKWLLININNMIEVRKSDLIAKRPGTVSTSSKPRLIWVQMLKQPESSSHREIYSVTRKFNNILEKIIAGDKRSHIFKLLIEGTPAHFDDWGNLMPRGKQMYWKVLDSTLRDFDLGVTELKPFHNSTIREVQPLIHTIILNQPLVIIMKGLVYIG